MIQNRFIGAENGVTIMVYGLCRQNQPIDSGG